MRGFNDFITIIIHQCVAIDASCLRLLTACADKQSLMATYIYLAMRDYISSPDPEMFDNSFILWQRDTVFSIPILLRYLRRLMLEQYSHLVISRGDIIIYSSRFDRDRRLLIPTARYDFSFCFI